MYFCGFLFLPVAAFVAFLGLPSFSLLLYDLSCFPCFSLLLSASLLFLGFRAFLCLCCAADVLFLLYPGLGLGAMDCWQKTKLLNSNIMPSQPTTVDTKGNQAFAI